MILTTVTGQEKVAVLGKLQCIYHVKCAPPDRPNALALFRICEVKAARGPVNLALLEACNFGQATAGKGKKPNPSDGL